MDADGQVLRTVKTDSKYAELALTEFGGRVAVGLQDGKLQRWNADGELCTSTQAHEGWIRDMVVVAPPNPNMYGDEKLLATASEDDTVKLWNLAGECVDTLRGHKSTVSCLATSEGMLASGSWDKTICVWGARSGRCFCTLQGHTDWVTCLTFFAGHLVSGSSDLTIRWWFPGFECVRVLEGHPRTIWSLACSDKLLFSACSSQIRVWSEEGDCVRTIAARSPFVPRLLFWKGCLVSTTTNDVTMWEGKRD